MKYDQRLHAAAQYVILCDTRSTDDPPLDFSELGITATLKPHQIEGVSWLIRRYLLGVNVILGDEMGLGKTLQAICLLSYLKWYYAPLSVTDGWASEFANFCPTLRVLKYVGDKGLRCDLRRAIFDHVSQQSSSHDVALPFDVLLTTYDIIMMDKDFLSQIPWCYTIIDEAQRLKNPSSVLYNVLGHHFVIPRRLLMTGTPIQNNLSELWALMHFCLPGVFGTLEQFVSAFKEVGILLPGHDATEGKKQFKALKYIIRAFMLRRTKLMLVESGALTLPPLTEITVMAPLVSLQKKVYVSIVRKELPKLLAVNPGASNHQSLQNIVVQLRKACSHPYLFNGIEPEPYVEGEHLIQASGKLIVLDKLLQKLHAAGHRVLLFAQMTHTLDILQDFLELRKYTYERLDGSIRAEERFAAIRSFSQQQLKNASQVEQHDAFVFMISTRAGGVGLNLVAADTVIFYEQDWNPQVDKQALQRAHRIGQLNHVLSINLVCAHTVEEVIMRRAQSKLQLSHNVIGDDTHEEGKDMGAETGDLRSLIVFGSNLIDPSENSEEASSGVDMEELNSMVEKVIETRYHDPDRSDRKFEINPKDFMRTSLSISLDPGLDEASYLSWVEKFKQASWPIDNSTVELEMKRKASDVKHLEHEAERKKKAEQKKLSKWEALGYHSLTIEDPGFSTNDELFSDSGSVQFVYGDCTDPSKVCPSEPTVIFSCIDNSGNWGHGGMFDALANLSERIPEAYQKASECGDLNLGDLHSIKINENNEEQMAENIPQWVALAVVQSYNPRRKVHRSNISLPDLEQCLRKASFVAAQNSASIHMPRIGYRDGSDHSEWYTAERLLRKYASLYGIGIFVYYYRRTA